MRRLLRRAVMYFARDDLLLRVVCLLGGIIIGALGVCMFGLGPARGAGGSLIFHIVYWAVAILLTGWGALLLSRCAVSARSPLASLIDGTMPDMLFDIPGLDEAVLLVVALLAAIFLPALLLTLLLRLFGVKGQPFARPAQPA